MCIWSTGNADCHVVPKLAHGKLPYYDSDIVLVNGGAIRCDPIVEYFNDVPLCMRDVIEIQSVPRCICRQACQWACPGTGNGKLSV